MRIHHSLKGDLPEQIENKAKFSLNELESTPVCGVDVPVVLNATWAYSSLDGSDISYTCDVGFVTNNGSSSFGYSCQSGSSIATADLSDTCNIVQCPRPDAMDKAVMIWPGGDTATTGDFGSTVDFQCDIGYSGDGKANGPRVVKMACDASGAYTFVLDTITSCLLVHCSVPLSMKSAAIPSAVDKTAVVPYNETVTYTCADGYVSSTDLTQDSYNLTCSDDGEFVPNDPLPRCTESVCPDPPLLDHSATIQISGKVPIDTRVIYRCDTGYFVSQIPASSTFNIRCEFINGYAQYTIPTPENRCKANLCLPMPDLDNAVVDSLNTVWRYTDIVPFRCIPGYTLGGEKGESTFEGFCNSQGVWTINDIPECDKVVCGTLIDIPPDLQEYAYVVPFNSTSVASYGMATTVVCTDGALVVGSAGRNSTFELVCGPDGEFLSSGGGICAIPCPVIPRVSFSMSRYFGTILEYGDIPAIITCKNGYQTSTGDADQQVVCNRDGTLSQISQCTPIPNYPGGNSGAGTDGTGTDLWAYQEPSALSDDAFLRKTSAPALQVVILTVVLMVIL